MAQVSWIMGVLGVGGTDRQDTRIEKWDRKTHSESQSGSDETPLLQHDKLDSKPLELHGHDGEVDPGEAPRELRDDGVRRQD
eukprot:scaffold80068_cov42-Phaeocystis_antarctica.AAC.2